MSTKFSGFGSISAATLTTYLVGHDGISNVRILSNDLLKVIFKNLNITGTIAHDTDTDHDIAFGATIAPDSTGSYLLSGSAMVKRVDASWSAGTGNGGLFSGSVAINTVYYYFAIRKDSDGSIDYGFDTSITATNKPVGYTYYALIGVGITDASANWIQGKWWREENKIYFRQLVFTLTRHQAALGTTNRLLITHTNCPPNSFADIIYEFTGNLYYFGFGATYETDAAPSGLDNSKINTYGGWNTFKAFVELDSNKQSYVRGSAGGGETVAIKTEGWYLNL